MQPRELDPSASVPAYFGAELRRYRKAAGLTQEELGEKISYTGALISLVEAAKRTPTRQFADSCDRALQTDGALSRIWPLVSRSTFPSWFRGYVELEATATAIRSIEPLLVPGLLQTADYARTVLNVRASRSPYVELDDIVGARIDRQSLLTKFSAPLCWFIVDETVLRRPIGDGQLMRAQLAAMLDASEMPNVVLQVVPYEAGEYAGLDGALTILSFEDGPDVGYTEGHGSASLIQSPEQLARCSVGYDLTRAVALSPKLSADKIRATMEDL